MKSNNGIMKNVTSGLLFVQRIHNELCLKRDFVNSAQGLNRLSRQKSGADNVLENDQGLLDVKQVTEQLKRTALIAPEKVTLAQARPRKKGLLSLLR